MRRTANTLIASAAASAAAMVWVPVAGAATPAFSIAGGGLNLVTTDLGGLWRSPPEADAPGLAPVLGAAPSATADGKAFAQSTDEALATPVPWGQGPWLGNAAASRSFSGTASAVPVGAARASTSALSVPEPDTLGLLLCGLVGLLGLAVRARVLAPSKRR